MNKFKYWILGIITAIGFSSYIAYAATWNLPPQIFRGDLIVATSTTQAVRLATSTKGSVLWMNPITSVPSWTATSSLGILGSGSGVTTFASTTSGNLFYGNVSGTTLTVNLPINLLNNVATGTTGNNFNISTTSLGSGMSMIINCPDSSASNRGCLTSTDWSTFNNKQAALSGGVPGQVAIWTSASAIGNGKLIDNGTVVGINATSSVISFLVQGSTTLTPFQINTSTGAVILQVTPAGRLGINSTTPNATLVVQGTTTSPSIDIFRAASSSGVTILNVTSQGTINLPTTTATALLGTDANKNIQSLTITNDTNVTGSVANSALVLGWTGTLANSRLNGSVVGNVSTGTAGNIFNISTTTNALIINMPTASASLTGQLSSTDWTTFNGKQAALSASNFDYLARWTSISALGIGKTIDNNTVGGYNATSSTVSWLVQGTTTLNPFQVNSSTGVSLLSLRANGSLGLGTTTNAVTMTVQGTSTLPTLDIFDVATNTGKSFLRVMNNGNVGISTSTPTVNFVVASSNGASVLQVNTNNGAPSTAVIFSVASSTGSLTELFSVRANNTTFATGTASSGSSQTGYWCYDGSSQLIRDSAVCLVSALKFKKDIKNLDVGCSELMKVQAVSYYKKDPLDEKDSHKQMGVIADNIPDSLKEMLVTYDENGEPHGFRYDQYTALITHCVQEQQVQIEQLQNGQVPVKSKWGWFGLLGFLGFIPLFKKKV